MTHLKSKKNKYFRKNFLFSFFWVFCLTFFSFSFITPKALGKSEKTDIGTHLKILPIQSAGRIKPFDSFAKESLQLIYGRKSFKGEDASNIVFTWMLIPYFWEKEPIVQVNDHQLKSDLGLDGMKSRFTPKELRGNEKVAFFIQELRKKRENNEKISADLQAVSRLENQLNLFYALSLGQMMSVAPSRESSRWQNVAELEGELKESFSRLALSFTKSLSLSRKGFSNHLNEKSLTQSVNKKQVSEAEQSGTKQLETTEPSKVEPFKVKQSSKGKQSEISLPDVESEGVKAALLNFILKAKSVAPEKYADLKKIKIEVHYNNLKPFMLSWVLYLMSFVFFFSFLFFINQKKKGSLLYKIGWGFMLGGFFLHTYGMALRVYLTGRPPVTNMYETILWVPWGSLILGMVLEWFYVQVYPLLAALLVGVLCLLLSDLAPSILDGSLHPLEPVLRDNFWLIIHVLTICLSYAAFFFAFFLSDIMLLFFILGEKKYKLRIKNGVQVIYRALQVGVLLLGSGTFLGGLWADYSWGRFWGWDPKETWALIALLGYIVLLHGKIAGWLRDFGMVVGSIIAFSSVVMAWYGVNFVLGQGLHSYGFGEGGRGFVFMFLSLHFLYVFYAYLHRKRKRFTAV